MKGKNLIVMTLVDGLYSMRILFRNWLECDESTLKLLMPHNLSYASSHVRHTVFITHWSTHKELQFKCMKKSRVNTFLWEFSPIRKKTILLEA